MGILEPVFTPDFGGCIDMPSGRQLRGYSDAESVDICDNGMGDGRHFRAWFSPGDREGKLASICFDIQNENEHGEAHPDMPIGRLATRTLAYFERTINHGLLIPRWGDSWQTVADETGPPDKNFTQYARNVLLGQNSFEAAGNTKMGRLAYENGFTEVTEVEYDDPQHLIVSFDRPGVGRPPSNG